jgi:hypothetical protein
MVCSGCCGSGMHKIMPQTGATACNGHHTNTALAAEHCSLRVAQALDTLTPELDRPVEQPQRRAS